MTSPLPEWTAVAAEAYERMAPHFARSETHARARRYVQGLLSATERTNGWPLAEHSGEMHPRGVQRLLETQDGTSRRCAMPCARISCSSLASLMACSLWTTGFRTHSAGVARQYSGTAGRRENQQGGAFVAYASEAGCTLIERELSVPREWFDAPLRCQEADIPPSCHFATKPQLAQQMLARALVAGVPVRWVVGIMAQKACAAGSKPQGALTCSPSPLPMHSGSSASRSPSPSWSCAIPRWGGSGSRLERAVKGHVATSGRGCACLIPALPAWRTGC